MRRRQEAAPPQPREDRLARVLARALRHHRDERRQVLVLAAQAVADPRPHAGVARLLVAGVHVGDRRVVVDRLGVHRLDDAHLVGDRLHVREQVAHPRAVLAAAPARPQRRDDRIRRLAGGHPGEPLVALDRGGDLLAVILARASACGRTDRRARSLRTGTGRGPASPSARSAAARQPIATRGRSEPRLPRQQRAERSLPMPRRAAEKRAAREMLRSRQRFMAFQSGPTGRSS